MAKTLKRTRVIPYTWYAPGTTAQIYLRAFGESGQFS